MEYSSYLQDLLKRGKKGLSEAAGKFGKSEEKSSRSAHANSPDLFCICICRFPCTNHLQRTCLRNRKHPPLPCAMCMLRRPPPAEHILSEFRFQIIPTRTYVFCLLPWLFKMSGWGNPPRGCLLKLYIVAVYLENLWISVLPVVACMLVSVATLQWSATLRFQSGTSIVFLSLESKQSICVSARPGRQFLRSFVIYSSSARYTVKITANCKS